MTTLEIYRAQFEEERTWWDSKPASKYKWAAHRIFDLVTYDSSLDEMFVKDIIEVCKVILEERTFEYIGESRDNYIKYILVCQTLHKFNWIEWGTSIRGAWFEIDYYYPGSGHERENRSRDILDELEWWGDEHHVIEGVPFTVENIKALVEFMEETE